MPQVARAGRYSHLAEPNLSTFRPQLTSLIDVMTFLLVFLIKSFSVQGDLVTPAANLQLPLSNTHTPPKVLTTIEISTNGVATDGKMLSSLTDADRSDSMLMPGVYKWMALLGSRFSERDKPHEILIQADREIEFAVLKRVMYSCSKAGFSDFNVLAIQKD